MLSVLGHEAFAVRKAEVGARSLRGSLLTQICFHSCVSVQTKLVTLAESKG